MLVRGAAAAVAAVHAGGGAPADAGVGAGQGRRRRRRRVGQLAAGAGDVRAGQGRAGAMVSYLLLRSNHAEIR